MAGDRSLTLATVVVLMSVAATLAYYRQPLPNDLFVETAIAAYEPVRALIRRGSRLGFVDANRDSPGQYLMLAQYALVPFVVDASITAAGYVITTPGAPDTLDRDPALAGFELMAVLDGGVRVYRRLP